MSNPIEDFFQTIFSGVSEIGDFLQTLFSGLGKSRTSRVRARPQQSIFGNRTDVAGFQQLYDGLKGPVKQPSRPQPKPVAKPP